MATMTDPMNALKQLQLALDRRLVSFEPCEIHTDVLVHVDEPTPGALRFTYAIIRGGKVQAISLFVLTEPVEEIPCFQMGWATRNSARGKGLASAITGKSVEEFSIGVGKHGLNQFYLEAIISDTNEASIRIAKKLLSEAPKRCTDSLSREPALQYLRLVSRVRWGQA